ncbi:MAG: purine-nucleoside phosphorylase [Deltaproteobacteria bacterium]|nr:purine-nucleoside phosphorylase [Deltaproteobacteria bacterium]
MSLNPHVLKAVEFLRSRSALRPSIGVILGSGLGDFPKMLSKRTSISYIDIPHFHDVGVAGHQGQLDFGILEGIPLVIQNGRFHYYEGYPMDEITFPTRVMAALGIKTLLVTNAAGGINQKYNPGDFMIIKDHINLMGTSPLRGPIPQDGSVRFVDLTFAYDRDCNNIIEKVAHSLQYQIHEGVYVGVHGPNYETPAEIRAYRTLGADAVGMSTIPEVIVANQLQLRVCGISCITNMAAGIHNERLDHLAVIQTASRVKENFIKLLERVISLLPQ